MNLFHCFLFQGIFWNCKLSWLSIFLQRKRPRISLGKYQVIIYTKLKLVTLSGLGNSPPSFQVMLGICIETAQFWLFRNLTHSPCIIALPPYVSWFMDPGMAFGHHVRTEVVEVTVKMADPLSALKIRQQIPLNVRTYVPNYTASHPKNCSPLWPFLFFAFLAALKVKLSLCMPWGSMGERRCSSTHD